MTIGSISQAYSANDPSIPTQRFKAENPQGLSKGMDASQDFWGDLGNSVKNFHEAVVNYFNLRLKAKDENGKLLAVDAARSLFQKAESLTNDFKPLFHLINGLERAFDDPYRRSSEIDQITEALESCIQPMTNLHELMKKSLLMFQAFTSNPKKLDTAFKDAYNGFSDAYSTYIKFKEKFGTHIIAVQAVMTKKEDTPVLEPPRELKTLDLGGKQKGDSDSNLTLLKSVVGSQKTVEYSHLGETLKAHKDLKPRIQDKKEEPLTQSIMRQANEQVSSSSSSSSPRILKEQTSPSSSSCPSSSSLPGIQKEEVSTSQIKVTKKMESTSSESPKVEEKIVSESSAPFLKKISSLGDEKAFWENLKASTSDTSV